MATNTRTIIDALKELYFNYEMFTTADFKHRYGYEASELEQIVYGLEKSNSITKISRFESLVYGKNPLLNIIDKNDFGGAKFTVPIKNK